jgi:hypothetical protein
MEAFEPDMIFISAGFDGHKDDIIGGCAAVKAAPGGKSAPAGYVEEVRDSLTHTPISILYIYIYIYRTTHGRQKKF